MAQTVQRRRHQEPAQLSRLAPRPRSLGRPSHSTKLDQKRHRKRAIPTTNAMRAEPDVRISRIRLSDKTSRLRPRHVVAKPAQTYEPEVPVEVREWIAPAPSSPDFVLGAQPPA